MTYHTIYDFSNRVVFIARGTGALGRTVVQKFITSGATTISSYIIHKEAEIIKAHITAAELIKANLTREDEILNMISILVKRFGHIDILVNVVGGHFRGRTITELDETDWDYMMSLNLKSKSNDPHLGTKIQLRS